MIGNKAEEDVFKTKDTVDLGTDVQSSENKKARMKQKFKVKPSCQKKTVTWFFYTYVALVQNC